MRTASFHALLVVALAGCPGGSGALGDHCSENSDCAGSLQCVAKLCAPRCQRSPDCGDGYACTADGLCKPATGQLGTVCTSEVDCTTGLACRLSDSGSLASTCDAQTDGAPQGAACEQDDDCRNRTCALGHCTDLCTTTRDCADGSTCASIPRVTRAPGAPPVFHGMFGGCLQAHGTLTWSIPIEGPSDRVLLPIPDTAISVAATFEVADQDQKVGAVHIVEPTTSGAPSGAIVLDSPATYYTDPVRHRPELGTSVLAMPSTPDKPLVPGAYQLDVTSLKPLANGTDLPGTATPTLTAVIKLDPSVILDVHFYFLNFDDHPCAAAFGGSSLNAELAQTQSYFQSDFLGSLKLLLTHIGLTPGGFTYEDLRDHPDLDELDTANAGALLELGARQVGINVFFVRMLRPIGLQAFGPNPGPAGLAGTRKSGIIVGLDALCYRNPLKPWDAIAHLAGHEIGRYMGLYDNVEIEPTQTDPISDTDDSEQNLMHYSEFGGSDLSEEQRDILGRSAVLR